MNPLPYTGPVMMLALCGVALPTGGTVSGKIRRWGAAFAFAAEVSLTAWALT
jgi:hypothetical protein